ncbi:hypothetical protein HanHA300_Chr00c0168g0723751 [Helianthus annuus]|nr:hypothetical protein HanHA300_Chr00c0168g0723751 [Helianthus annuus]KAJ0639155.1 hypothetical protein HanLR1_Chr16g0600721 [Helianthus annuus]
MLSTFVYFQVAQFLKTTQLYNVFYHTSFLFFICKGKPNELCKLLHIACRILFHVFIFQEKNYLGSLQACFPVSQDMIPIWSIP